MKFGSLFAGIGGLDLGLERAGMECAWQVEIDEFCQKVLTKHWPDVPKYGDIRDVGKQNLETVDLICGGFPCQPFSVAGKRRGTEDDRHLWPEMLRVISELRPTWVVAENVPGIIPIFLYQAIFDLAREGYQTLPIVLPACGFQAPHLRYRLFIIAYNAKGRLNGKDLPIRSRRQDKAPIDLSGTRKIVADSKGKQSRRLQQPKIQANIRGNCKGPTPNPSIERRDDRKTPEECRQPKRQTGRCNSEGILRNTTTQGLQNRELQTMGGKEKRNPILQSERPARWEIEPGVDRVVDGFPGRVDRLKSLGNAVVPQVAEHIGRMIMEANQ